MTWWRPVVSADPALQGPRVAGGWTRLVAVEPLSRGAATRLAEPPLAVLAQLTAPRADICGLTMDRPRIMAILNVTPDSFSDGGLWADPARAVEHALQMQAEGADIIDIGGESTRPGAAEVPVAEEIARVVPVIAAIRAASAVPISIDTRKAAVAQAALDAGASMVNDVSALAWDAGMAAVVARWGVPLCLMHAQGVPQTMQADPHYDDVLLDVADHLAARIAVARDAGIAADRLIVDPGIGFGKTVKHNVSLLQRVSLFHALQCPVLIGVSRKRFIGVLGDAPDVGERLPGSLATLLHAVSQGVQILRVHDTKATRQALSLHEAVSGMKAHGTEAVRD